MNKKTIEQFSKQILEKNGGKIADKAKTILLDDPALKELHEPLEFISNNWRDITPALMSLSCEAVGGKPEETHDVALALCLMNLSFTIWDDLIDNAKSKAFKSTIYGKFGQGISLILGGLASAKAFTILNQSKLNNAKRRLVGELIWDLWSKMATAEVVSLKTKEKGVQSSKIKFWKMKSEAIDLASSLKIGAIIGGGSDLEIKHLFKYGKNLSLIMALTFDFQVSVNLTLELAEKIRNNRLPYSLLWATEHSTAFRLKLKDLQKNEKFEQQELEKLVNLLIKSGLLHELTANNNKYKKRAMFELKCLPATEALQSLDTLVAARYEILNAFLA